MTVTADPVITDRRRRGAEYVRYLRAVIALHPRLFITAVAGAFVYAVCTVASSFAIQWTIDEVIIPSFDHTDEGTVATSVIVTGCALIIGIGLLRAAGVVVRRTWASRTQWRIAETLTGRITDRLIEQPASWYQRHSDGQLVARASVDIDTTIRVMAPIPFATSTVLMMVVAAIYLIVVDPVMGLVATAMFPVLVFTNVIYQRLVADHYDEAQDALGEFSTEVHESFEAVQLIKAYGAERRETERLSMLANRIRDPRIRAVRVRGTFEALLEALPALTNIALVVLGAVRVDSGQLTIGELSGFIYMFTLLVFPLRLIGYALSELPQSYAGYSRVEALLAEPLEPDPRRSQHTATGGSAVDLNAVSFTYVGDDHPTITDCTAHFDSGRVAALVGPTGSGKSTLVYLIGGLLAPDVGTISVEPGTRTVVFQEAFLFGGTIRDNIHIDEAHPNHSTRTDGTPSSDDEAWAALRLAAGEHFVRDLPAGLDTVVGERGVTLSGGQRQRIALARALARRPDLILLDDTTSALDPATEQAVLSNLREAFAATVIIVASRPSTIALADEVYFVDGGTIVDHGDHRDLYARQPLYRELVDAFESDRETDPEEDGPR